MDLLDVKSENFSLNVRVLEDLDVYDWDVTFDPSSLYQNTANSSFLNPVVYSSSSPSDVKNLTSVTTPRTTGTGNHNNSELTFKSPEAADSTWWWSTVYADPYKYKEWFLKYGQRDSEGTTKRRYQGAFNPNPLNSFQDQPETPGQELDLCGDQFNLNNNLLDYSSERAPSSSSSDSEYFSISVSDVDPEWEDLTNENDSNNSEVSISSEEGFSTPPTNRIEFHDFPETTDSPDTTITKPSSEVVLDAPQTQLVQINNQLAVTNSAEDEDETDSIHHSSDPVSCFSTCNNHQSGKISEFFQIELQSFPPVSNQPKLSGLETNGYKSLPITFSKSSEVLFNCQPNESESCEFIYTPSKLSTTMSYFPFDCPEFDIYNDKTVDQSTSTISLECITEYELTKKTLEKLDNLITESEERFRTLSAFEMNLETSSIVHKSTSTTSLQEQADKSTSTTKLIGNNLSNLVPNKIKIDENTTGILSIHDNNVEIQTNGANSISSDQICPDYPTFRWTPITMDNVVNSLFKPTGSIPEIPKNREKTSISGIASVESKIPKPFFQKSNGDSGQPMEKHHSSQVSGIPRRTKYWNKQQFTSFRIEK